MEVPRNSNIIRIVFRHPDPQITQIVLQRLVDTYLEKHVKIHQGIGVLDEFFSQQAAQIRAQLSTTEDELNRVRTNAQVISLDDTKRAYAAQVSRIQDDLLSAEAELAGQKAALGEFPRLAVTRPETNAPAELIPVDVADQYRMAVAESDALRKREMELLMRFAAEHPFVIRTREQLQEADARKKRLEQETPALPSSVRPAAGSPIAANDGSSRVSRVLELEARIKILTNHQDRVRAEAIRVMTAEPVILQLTRKRDLEAANYNYYDSAVRKARVDESLGAGKITNISVIQSPSPPARDAKELYKPMGMALAGGLFAGLALAFLLERVLNQSIKRVVDLERALRIPLLLSVPDTAWGRRFRFGRSSRNGHRPEPRHAAVPQGRDENADAPTTGQMAAVANQGNGPLAAWEPGHELRAYHEALRDRLITYFEVRNMTHKPKLVAVTSCHQGAGVTSMASGLAAALSETGDGNVLLVDMNLEQGAAHQFHKGKPAPGLSEAFEAGKADTARVQENLYLVSARETNDQKLPRVLPKRFANLVPKMKASDYDYIIFDMPPVAQTSITARLSGYMDMVLMVVESERTGQELAKRANALLHESKANVTAVLNKSRAYVPDRLRQEL